jgi:hypothetical protein
MAIRWAKGLDDTGKALVDAGSATVQTTAHVGSTVIKTTGTWNEVDIKKENEEAQLADLVDIPKPRQ